MQGSPWIRLQKCLMNRKYLQRLRNSLNPMRLQRYHLWVKVLLLQQMLQKNRENTSRQISVQFGEHTIVYELNDGTAADSLYEQLPLTIEVENYSTNEKIFYPQQALDTSGSPLAQAGAGTLAYFEPWGDVVFFYGDYNENPSLFELGQVVSGGEWISEMSGTITIDVAG